MKWAQDTEQGSRKHYRTKDSGLASNKFNSHTPQRQWYMLCVHIYVHISFNVLRPLEKLILFLSTFYILEQSVNHFSSHQIPLYFLKTACNARMLKYKSWHLLLSLCHIFTHRVNEHIHNILKADLLTEELNKQWQLHKDSSTDTCVKFKYQQQLWPTGDAWSWDTFVLHVCCQHEHTFTQKFTHTQMQSHSQWHTLHWVVFPSHSRQAAVI